MTCDRTLDGTYAGTLADFEPEPPYYQTPDGKVTLYHGHVLDVLREMPAESVNCVCTSPPYWSLRRYDCPDQSWGDWVGQHGLEETPELYVEHTLMWLREVRRVLRKDGTCWVNLGDSMAGGNSRYGTEETASEKQRSNSGTMTFMGQRPSAIAPGLKAKDCVLMPFRVALAAQAEGWWVRSVIIWAKPNPMPESVRDRPTDAHEYIFLLTKSKTYWYDADAVRERAIGGNDHDLTGQGYAAPGQTPQAGNRAASHKGSYFDRGKTAEHQLGRASSEPRHDSPNGRNCRSVWTFSTEPFPDAHFAVFPRELPTRCIKAGCPEWVCPKCGKARVRVTERAKPVASGYAPGRDARDGKERFCSDTGGYSAEFATLGWTDCDCGAGFVGGVVLDPFAGSGTTCEVAYHLGRTAIGIDASAKYLDMAIERVKQGVLAL